MTELDEQQQTLRAALALSWINPPERDRLQVALDDHDDRTGPCGTVEGGECAAVDLARALLLLDAPRQYRPAPAQVWAHLTVNHPTAHLIETDAAGARRAACGQGVPRDREPITATVDARRCGRCAARAPEQADVDVADLDVLTP